MSLSNQRIVYLNGKFVPEDEATIPIKDQGFKYGDGVFDTKKLFTDKLPFSAGIATGFGGVYVGTPPNLLFEQIFLTN